MLTGKGDQNKKVDEASHLSREPEAKVPGLRTETGLLVEGIFLTGWTGVL
jgi:hypothetical protein